MSPNKAQPAQSGPSGNRHGSITAVAGVDELPPGWQRACEQTERQSMFLGPIWLRKFLNWFPDEPGARPLLLVSHDPDRSGGMGLLPLVQNDRHVRSLANYYTTVYGMLGDIGADACRRHADAFVDYLASARPRITQVRLQPMVHGQPDYQSLAEAFRDRKWAVEQFFCAGNWYLENRFADFDDYLESRPGRLRNTIKRKRKKLERSGASIDIYRDARDIQRHLEDYETVYKSSWKVDEPYQAFIRDMVDGFAREGAVRLGVVCFEGQPIAAQIWIVRHGTAAIYKLAYDEAYKEQSAGTVLSAELFRHAIDIDRVDTIDYLTGDDPYKQEWMTSRRELWGLAAYNPATLEGACRAGLLAIKKLVRMPTAPSSLP